MDSWKDVVGYLGVCYQKSCWKTVFILENGRRLLALIEGI
jgi:hypothetical protein